MGKLIEDSFPQVVMDWLGKLLGLPPSFLSTGSGGRGGGCIQGTASEAAVVALLAGRSRALAGRPHEDHTRLVAYTSDQARQRADELFFFLDGLDTGREQTRFPCMTTTDSGLWSHNLDSMCNCRHADSVCNQSVDVDVFRP